MEILTTAVYPVVAKESVASWTFFPGGCCLHVVILLYVELVSLESCFYQGELNAGLSARSIFFFGVAVRAV